MKKLFFLALLIASIACHHEDDNDCSDKKIEVKHLENEYGCTNIDINLSDNYMIIRNFSDYTQYVSNNCQTDVDFNTYDLVIGKQQLSNGLASIEYELIENCKTGDQHLKISFKLSDTAEAPNVTYNALIPKLDENQELNVEIIIKR